LSARRFTDDRFLALVGAGLGALGLHSIAPTVDMVLAYDLCEFGGLSCTTTTGHVLASPVAIFSVTERNIDVAGTKTLKIIISRAGKSNCQTNG